MNMENIFRMEPIKLVNQFLNIKKELDKEVNIEERNRKQLHALKNKIKKLPYQDLLIIQSSNVLWEELMHNSDFHFRRFICKRIANLTEIHLMEALNYSSSGAANQLFNITNIPDLPRAFQLGVLFGHPWQIVNKKDPDELSYSSFSEYFYHGVAKRINIRTLGNEQSNVSGIAGYVITDPQELFRQEFAPITGRWVTTYHEMDYFEFHLSSEPFLDKETRMRILDVFPEAKDIIRTYIPFRPDFKALWIMIPKPGKEIEYNRIRKELVEYRYETASLYSIP